MVSKHHRRNLWLTAAAGLIVCADTSVAEERLVEYKIVNGGIPKPLTNVPGDPRRGKAVAANAEHGNCLICHAMPIAEAPVFGDFGPPLHGVASRLSPAQLRLRIVDSRAINPSSTMPAYYKVNGLHRVQPAYRGKPILSAQEIEDLIAYLMTLTESRDGP
jgi:sulfur-oxidizing protein SoxX